MYVGELWALRSTLAWASRSAFRQGRQRVRRDVERLPVEGPELLEGDGGGVAVAERDVDRAAVAGHADAAHAVGVLDLGGRGVEGGGRRVGGDGPGVDPAGIHEARDFGGARDRGVEELVFPEGVVLGAAGDPAFAAFIVIIEPAVESVAAGLLADDGPAGAGSPGAEDAAPAVDVAGG